MNEYAIYAITKHGLSIAKKIKENLPGADLYVSPKFIGGAPEGSIPLSLPMEPVLRKTLHAYNCHIFVISVGAVVRMIAPLLINKKVDPAVLCIDDKARFTICVLSGHVGRGNFFAQKVSGFLENISVITTASDVAGTLTVDILGRELGWTLEDMDRIITKGCAAVVNEERVLFVQESGEPDWWPFDKKLPRGVEYTRTLEGVRPEDFEIILICTDRSDVQRTHPAHYERGVVYHPKTLFLGLGCDKNISFEVLERGVLKILDEKNLSLKSVKGIASFELKQEEPAMVELSQKYQWPFAVFSAEELEEVKGIENPSAVVKKYVGTSSVSEACALKAAKTSKLLVPKTIYKEEEGGKNMTMAVGRLEYPHRASVV